MLSGRKNNAAFRQGPYNHVAPAVSDNALEDHIRMEAHVTCSVIVTPGAIILRTHDERDYVLAKKEVLKIRPAATIKRYEPGAGYVGAGYGPRKKEKATKAGADGGAIS